MRRNDQPRFEFTRGLWILFVLIVFAFGTAKAGETIPDSLKANTGYYCYVRCLAQCVQQGATALDTDCHAKCDHLDDDTLCSRDDTNCWRSCKNFLQVNTASIPLQPQNVSVAYVSSPQPTPWEADVRWQPSEKANLYLVQYVDTTDSFKSWAKGGLSINATPTTYWHFVKPNLCPEYAFRVASVNEYGVSSFSEIVNLSKPIPVVPTAEYSVKSAELLPNVSFIDASLNSNEALYNSTVQLVISFAPPPNWIMDTEIIKARATLHVSRCSQQGYGPFSPLIRQRPGEWEFEVRLPGWMSAMQSECKLLFVIDSLYTKCDPSNPAEYPILYEEPTRKPLAGFELTVSCKNIRGSVCPYSAISTAPSCAVANLHLTNQFNNHTSLINTTVSFDQVLAPKDAPMLYYYVRHGEAYREDDDEALMPVPVRQVNLSHNAEVMQIDKTSRHFTLTDLDPHKLYAVQICAMYENARPDNLTWDRYKFYEIDLAHYVSPDVTGRDQQHGIATEQRSTYIIAGTVCAGVIMVIACVFLFAYMRMKKSQRKSIAELKPRPEGYDDGRYIIMPNRIDKWELERQNLAIFEDQKLGSGAFGSVFKGKVIMPVSGSRHGASAILAENWTRVENGEAAVKLLPEYADENSKSDFRREINLMKTIGYHERLVNMLGCITVNEPLCLVVEYCQEGDLLHYLRDRRNYMIRLEEQNIDLNNLAENEQVNMDLILCFKDLLSFAWQISVGLEYLSQKGYIHRDVAARNILVDKGKKAKIGDFGLCRYSLDDSVYLSHGGRLPLKWMALEAIKNYEFTTKSDVWSYGVLLFEIITMGGNPYPGLQPNNLESYLEGGNRMERPDNCPEVLYAIMMDCWQRSPDDRPLFTVLRERLRLLLEELTMDYSYMTLNQARDYYNVIPTDYPSLASFQTQMLPSLSVDYSTPNPESPINPMENAGFEMEEDDQSDSSSIQLDSPTSRNDMNQETSQSSDLSSGSGVSSTALTPGGAITGASQRDSATSDQLLITPTTPKFRFFKFKTTPGVNSSKTLDVLHEGGSADSMGGDGSDGRSYANSTYVEDLLPHSAVIYHS